MTVCSAAVVAPRSFQCVMTLCRPDSKNEKTSLKLSLIEVPEKREKRLRPLGRIGV
jgi:hypothetical protein